MSHPYCYLGSTCQLELFFTMRYLKQPAYRVRFCNIGASACLMVTFNGFCESHKPLPLGDARGNVSPHCHSHQNGQHSGYMLHCRFVCCRPGNRRGNTEQVVVVQWRCPVASGEALVMLHWEMRSVWHWHTTMAIKMACNGGASVCRRHLF